MRSKGQMLFVDSGQSVQLKCEFVADGYNLFDNPIVWKKVQRDEESQINVMSNIIEPFLSTDKLTVGLRSNPPLFRLTLSIQGR